MRYINKLIVFIVFCFFIEKANQKGLNSFVLQCLTNKCNPIEYLIPLKEKCFPKNDSPLMSIEVYLNKNQPIRLTGLLNSCKYQIFTNYELLFYYEENLNEEKKAIIKNYQEEDKRIILVKKEESNNLSPKGKVLLAFHPDDMFISNITLYKYSQRLDEFILIQEYIKTLLGLTIVRKNFPLKFCKEIITYIDSGKKVKDFTPRENMYQLYSETNYCLKRYKNSYLVPLVKNSKNYPQKTHYKTVYFFSYNRNYTKKELDNIEEKIITKKSEVMKYGTEYYRLKIGILGASGFVKEEPGKIIPNLNNWWFIKKLFIKKKRLYSSKLNEFIRLGSHPSINLIDDKGGNSFYYNKLKKLFPKDFNYGVETYSFPEEKNIILKKFKNYKLELDNLWLIKPKDSMQGKQIKFLLSEKDIKGNIVLSKYISNPFLINGRKTNYRVYVLITGFDPLRVYVHKYGYIYISTRKYELTKDSIINNNIAHVTNLVIGENDIENFVFSNGEDENGSVLSTPKYKEIIEKNGGNFTVVFDKIKDVVIKVLLTTQGTIRKKTFEYGLGINNNYDIVGYDFLLDDKFEPHFLEINIDPGFHVDHESLKRFKDKVYADSMTLIGLVPFNHDTNKPIEKIPKRKFKNKAEKNLDNVKYELGLPRGDYELIFPVKKTMDKYTNLFLDKTESNRLLWKYIRNKNDSKDLN